MPTLKEFEEELRLQGMTGALAVLQRLRERDKAKRTIAPARRVVGKKMTPEVARQILDLHATTGMTQQEIAFSLGVNQGRVNEVIKHGKWLSADPNAPERAARDEALARMEAPRRPKPSPRAERGRARQAGKPGSATAKAKPEKTSQLAFFDL
jgi:hypothetical protein